MTILIELFYWAVAYTIYKIIIQLTSHTNSDASYIELYSMINKSNNINNIPTKKICKKKLYKIVPETLDTSNSS